MMNDDCAHTRAFHVVDNRSADQVRSTPPDLSPVNFVMSVLILSNAEKD